MIVSHRHRFIFLKTMKTASSSMELALSRHLGPEDIITPAQSDLEAERHVGRGGQNYRLDHPAVPKRPLWRRLLGRPERYYHPTVGYYEHMPAWRVKTYLGDEIWNSYFKFAFERNPWDRQVSYYHFKTRSKDTPESFQEFIAKGKRAHVPNWDIYTIDNEVAVDFLGRYENLAEDWDKALSHIPTLEGETALPKINVGTSKPKKKKYLDYYSDDGRAWVAERYAAEIALLGYTFGD